MTTFYRHAIMGVVASGVTLSATLATYPLCMRLLGERRFGLWLLLNTVLIVAQSAAAGLPHAVARSVADAHVRGDLARASAVASTAMWSVLGAAPLCIALLYSAGRLASGSLGLRVEEKESFVCLLPPVVGLALYSVVVQIALGAVAGAGLAGRSAILVAAGRVVNLAVATCLLLLGFDLHSMVVGGAAGAFVSHALARYSLHKRQISCSLRDGRWHVAKELLPVGLSVGAGSLLNVFTTPFNRFVVTTFIGLDWVAPIDLAYAAASQLRTLIETGLRALVPEMNRADGASGTLVAKAQALTAAFGATLFLAVSVAAPTFLNLLVERPEHALPVFRLMMLAGFLGLLCAVPYYALIGIGDGRALIIGHFLAVAGNVGFMCISIGTNALTPQSVPIAIALGATTSLAYMYSRWRSASTTREAYRMRESSGPMRDNGSGRPQPPTHESHQ